MGSVEQKRFRQKYGKRLIQYLSNIAVINQINNWANVNDAANGQVPQKTENAGNRETLESCKCIFKSNQKYVDNLF